WVEWSPAANDNRLATSTVDGTIQIRDGNTLNPLISIQAVQGRAAALSWSPDGSKVATGSSESNRIQVWNSFNGNLLNNLDGHSDTITSLDWHPGGLSLASSSV